MKATTFSNDFLKLILLGTAIANIADNAASSPLASLYYALHSADPGAGGDQTTSEIAYTSYARKQVSRSATDFSVTGNTGTNVLEVAFPEKTGGSNVTPSHWSLGTATSGAGKILFRGPIATVNYGPFTGATSDTLTIPGHALIVDDRCVFYALFGSSLPTGITEGTVYWVKTAGTDVITISTTQGGSTLDVTAVGDGVVYKAKAITITDGIVPAFAASTVVIKEY